MALLKNKPSPKGEVPTPLARTGQRKMAELMHARVVVPAKQTKRSK